MDGNGKILAIRLEARYLPVLFVMDLEVSPNDPNVTRVWGDTLLISITGRPEIDQFKMLLSQWAAKTATGEPNPYVPASPMMWAQLTEIPIPSGDFTRVRIPIIEPDPPQTEARIDLVEVGFDINHRYWMDFNVPLAQFPLPFSGR